MEETTVQPTASALIDSLLSNRDKRRPAVRPVTLLYPPQPRMWSLSTVVLSLTTVWGFVGENTSHYEYVRVHIRDVCSLHAEARLIL